MSCAGCELEAKQTYGAPGLITSATISPMEADGECVVDMQTGECAENEPCHPDTQEVTFNTTSPNRHRAVLTPLNGPAGPVSLHFSGTNSDGSPGDPSLTVKLSDRFTPEQLAAECGATAFMLELFEKVPGPPETLVRKATATIGCTPCTDAPAGD